MSGTQDADGIRWSPAGEHVLFARQGALGRIRLNRPSAINALTLEMITAITAQLREWAQEPSIRAVALDGAGERGLCAGGDVRAIRQWLLSGRGEAGSDQAVLFWDAEYRLDRLIAEADLPVAALMDGVVMGGGIGLAGHASLRLVTHRTRVAMPETGIGFFPDVGALFPLSRAPGELGTYLALTGASITGSDAIAVGLADAMIERDTWEGLCAQWADGAPLNAPRTYPSQQHGGLRAQQPWIEACFTGSDAPTTLARLLARPEPEAHEAATTLRSRCPFSVALTLEATRRAADLPSVADVLAQDLRLGTALMRGPAAADFIEGVRAVLVDRDQAPQWRHDSLAAVERREVLELF